MTTTISPPQTPTTDRPGADRPGTGGPVTEVPSRTGVTEVIRRLPRPSRPGGTSRPPRKPVGRPLRPAAPRQLAPRDSRWWAGAAILVVSLLLIAFVAHVAVFSALQHHRAQDLAYQDLRVNLAKAEAPVGQLDSSGDLVPLGEPVAFMQIPAIGLDDVISEGSTSEVLREGPGHRRDSVMPGQEGTSVILGRQTTYGGPFGSLNQLVPGDEITVTTGQGVHTYTVFGIRRAGDPLPEELRADSGRLELITADGLALLPSGALHVDAELTSETQQTPSKVMAYQALPVTEKAMGQDTDAALAALFALLIFLAAGVTLWWLWTAWGRWQTWLVGIPVMVALGATVADTVMNVLPNLL